MGNQATSDFVVNRPSQPGQWTSEDRTAYCQIVRNNFTHELAQQYVVPTPSNINLQQNLNMYQYRRTHNSYTVGVIHVQKQQGGYFCQGQDFLKIKTERIPVRLSEKRVISEKEALNIIRDSLRGYKQLFEFLGGFQINDDMIGFNQSGQVKVWLNSNFALNSPDISPNIGNRMISETDIINQLFSVVQEHVEGRIFSPQFKDDILKKYPKSFNEALQILQSYRVKVFSMIPNVSQITHSPLPKSSHFAPSTSVQYVPPHPVYSVKNHQNISQVQLNPNNNSASNISQSMIKLNHQVLLESQKPISHNQHTATSFQLNSQQLMRNTQNFIPMSSRIQEIKQHTNHAPLLIKSRIQETGRQKTYLFKTESIKDSPKIITEKKVVSQNNRTLQFNQQPQISPRKKQLQFKPQYDLTTRRPSLYQHRTKEIDVKKKPQSTNIQFKRYINDSHRLKPAAQGSKTFTSKSVSKQYYNLNNSINSRSFILPQHQIDKSSMHAPPSQTRIASNSTINPKISGRLVEAVNHTSSRLKDLNSSEDVKNHLQSQSQPRSQHQPQPQAKVENQAQHKVFPKPSLAVERLTIQKVDHKPSNNLKGQERQIFSTNNQTPTPKMQRVQLAINPEPSTILSRNRDQTKLDADFKISCETKRQISNKGPAVKVFELQSQIQSANLLNAPISKYEYQFSHQPKSPKSFHKDNFESLKTDSPEFSHQRYREMATPKFQNKSFQQQLSTDSPFNAQIQRLISQHEADKQELLRIIKQYENSSRFERSGDQSFRAKDKQKIYLQQKQYKNQFLRDLDRQLELQAKECRSKY